jgi:hypothetical protein
LPHDPPTRGAKAKAIRSGPPCRAVCWKESKCSPVLLRIKQQQEGRLEDGSSLVDSACKGLDTVHARQWTGKTDLCRIVAILACRFSLSNCNIDRLESQPLLGSCFTAQKLISLFLAVSIPSKGPQRGTERRPQVKLVGGDMACFGEEGHKVRVWVAARGESRGKRQIDSGDTACAPIPSSTSARGCTSTTIPLYWYDAISVLQPWHYQSRCHGSVVRRESFLAGS